MTTSCGDLLQALRGGYQAVRAVIPPRATDRMIAYLRSQRLDRPGRFRYLHALRFAASSSRSGGA
ncbi:Hypothetical protein FRAAL6430 [Frankia alni ACN14a]|uniref:Uncharacterized protein n=1 Tax=Frankia alni (strain DSM 45986 / CECT 9034 / ACN14a) TaxID=326424 RepID=Q0RBX7_FRAAA|nr:Hypothetical protein FRAAL6430 [Frankia alni ACN14a]